jgi:hypothetical protein
MNEYKRYKPYSKGLFSLLTKEANTSLKHKYCYNLQIQNIEPTWHLLETRRSHKTKEERDALESGTGFTIIGDPVAELRDSKKYFFCSCNTCGFKAILSKIYLAKKKVNCVNCFNNRLASEASSVGLTLIGTSHDSDAKRRRYLFNSCGHMRDISTGDVRNGSVSCKECYQIQLEESLAVAELTNLGRPDETFEYDRTQYFIVRYNKCGHIRAGLQRDIVLRTLGPCTVCYEQDLKNAYEDKYNIEILDKLKGTNRKIRFRACGHERSVGLSNLKAGSFECNECIALKFAEQAKASGLLYIGPDNETTLKGKHLYKAPCQHEISLTPYAVKLGHWTCRTCNSGYLDRPNKLYLFEVTCKDFTFLKMGYSTHPDYRKNDYKAIQGTKFNLLKSVEVLTGREAIVLENSLHSKYSEYNYPKELMKTYLTESGFTECYPMSIKDSILEDFNSIQS